MIANVNKIAALTLGAATLAWFLTGCGNGPRFGSNGGGLEATDKSSKDTTASSSGQKSSRSFSAQQIVRSLELYQGLSGKTAFDQFEQANVSSGFLDILIVIDNSASMLEEQLNLASRLSVLLEDPLVQASSWQIGVVTTDPNDASFEDPTKNCMRGFIKKGDSNAAAAFSQAVGAGTDGDPEERGILNAVRGLRSECLKGKTWLRDSSTLAVLFVSDEDNCSNSSDLSCKNKEDQKADYLINYLSSIRKLGEETRVYGVIWAPGTSSAACSTALNIGNTYYEVIKASGGTSGSICDTDFSPTLRAMSKDLSTILRPQFPLSIAPPPGSYMVSVNDAVISSGFRIEGKTLTFEKAPNLGSRIKVAYDAAKYPMFDRVDLDVDVQKVMEVAVNRSPMDPEAWSFDSSTHQIRFHDAPPEGAEIKLLVLKPSSGADNIFEIDSTLDPGTVEVRVESKSVPFHLLDVLGCKTQSPCRIQVDVNLNAGDQIEVLFHSK